MGHGILGTVVWVLAGAVMASCASPVSTSGKTKIGGDPTAALRTEDVDGTLWVVRPDGVRQKLTDEGEKGYSVTISGQNDWIIVDAAPFSTLQVTRVFKRGQGGSFSAWSGEPVARKAWALVEAVTGLPADELLNPRTRFVRWDNEPNQFVLECTWRTEDGADGSKEIVVDLQRGTLAER